MNPDSQSSPGGRRFSLRAIVMGIGVGVVSGILIGAALRSMILGISVGVIIGIILGVVAEGKDIKRHVMGRTKIIIIGVIVVSIVVFLVFSEFSKAGLVF